MMILVKDTIALGCCLFRLFQHGINFPSYKNHHEVECRVFLNSLIYIYIYIYIYTSAVSVDLQCNFIDVTFGKGQSMYCDSVTGH